MNKIVLFSLLILGAIVFGCNDDSDTPTPTTTTKTDTTNTDTTKVQMCDTIQSIYTDDVATIIMDNCAPCHVNGRKDAGVDLGDYASTKAEAEKPRFIGAIKHSDGFDKMPQGQPQLDQVDIDRIDCWISNGFKEN